MSSFCTSLAVTDRNAQKTKYKGEGFLCYAHPEVLHELVLHQFFFCPIRDRDCVAHHPLTLRHYLDVGIDFTGLFFLSDLAAWRDGRHPRGRSFAPPSTSPPRPHIDLCRLVVAFTDWDAFTDFAHCRFASRYSV